MPHAVLHSICKCNNILEKILTQSVRRRKASCLGSQPGTSQTCRPQPCLEDPHHCSCCRQRSIPCCESFRHIPELWTRDLGERLKMNTILSKRCYLMLVTIAQSDVLCQVSSELNISLTSQDHVVWNSLNIEFCFRLSQTVAIVEGALKPGRGGIGFDQGCHDGNDDCRRCTSTQCCGEGHRGWEVREGWEVCRWTTVSILASICRVSHKFWSRVGIFPLKL